MTPTFYGVLGVGPDADADAIKCGYREHVREVHPDLNDDPDADAQFRRLTTAKETLLDADERSRYDRLGHASYVRHHTSCSAWEETVPTTGRNGSSNAARDDSTSNSPGDSTSNDPDDSEGKNQSGRGGRRHPYARDRTDRSRSDRSWGGAQTADRRGSDSTSSEHTARASEAERSRAQRRSADGRRRNGGWTWSTGADAAGDVSYAMSSFWETQRVGQRYGTASSGADPLSLRLFRVLRALGPWTLVHLIFLTSAVGTSWYVYVVVLDPGAASLPLLVVLVGEIALAAALSTIHVVTRVYR